MNVPKIISFALAVGTSISSVYADTCPTPNAPTASAFDAIEKGTPRMLGEALIDPANIDKEARNASCETLSFAAARLHKTEHLKMLDRMGYFSGANNEDKKLGVSLYEYSLAKADLATINYVKSKGGYTQAPLCFALAANDLSVVQAISSSTTPSYYDQCITAFKFVAPSDLMAMRLKYSPEPGYLDLAALRKSATPEAISLVFALKIVNLYDSLAEELAHAYAANNRFESVEKTLINIQNSLDPSGLFAAIRSGDVGGVKQILKNLGSDAPKVFEDRTVKGALALHAAAGTGNLQIVKALVEAGANVKKTADEEYRPKMTVINYAIDGRNPEVVSYLLSKGAPKTFTESDPLAQAISPANLDLSFITMLIANGFKVNGESLDLAIKAGNIPLVQTLIKAGADVSNYRQNGQWTMGNSITPLMEAVEQENLPIVKLLLDSGAKTEVRMDSESTYYQFKSTKALNQTVLMLAVDRYSQKAFLVKTSDEDRRSLHALYNIISLLLKSGASTKSVDSRNDSAMHYCSWKAFRLKALLEKY